MLTQAQLDLIKASVPVLATSGEDITRRFYGILFSRNPELENVFNMANQRKSGASRQSRALAETVFAYAQNIETPENLTAAVMRIAHKHVSLNIQPEQYDLVGAALLEALAQHLDVTHDHPMIEAWAAAYGDLAKIFIEVEEGLYQASEQQEGGWRGYRRFKLVRKQAETDQICSFYLQPEDGKPIPSFKAGQYIGVKLDIPGQPNTEIRQYSLSDSPTACAEGGYYRISVKKEGVVSSYLHDVAETGEVLEISAPLGDFTLREEKGRAAVFLSAGVGVTPVFSMLSQRAAIGQTEGRDLYLHFAQNPNLHALKEAVSAICADNKVRDAVAYEEGEGGLSGRISADMLGALDLPLDADYYLCGPHGFMVAANALLLEKGVNEAHIHAETFGPTVSLAA